MTVSTHDQRFAPSLGHFLHPPRLRFPPFLLEIGEFANVMNLYVCVRPTEFTCVRKKPFDKFITVAPSLLRVGWVEIGQDCLFLPSQRYASELCYQGFLSVSSLNDYL
jgi:hypothetical protein